MTLEEIRKRREKHDLVAEIANLLKVKPENTDIINAVKNLMHNIELLEEKLRKPPTFIIL